MQLVVHRFLQGKLDVAVDGIGDLQKVLCSRSRHEEYVIYVPFLKYARWTWGADAALDMIHIDYG